MTGVNCSLLLAVTPERGRILLLCSKRTLDLTLPAVELTLLLRTVPGPPPRDR